MRRSTLCFLVVVLFFPTAGCGTDQGSDSGSGGTGGGGGTPGDLEWPPNATAYFDDYNILNADCATDEDCAMVLGYYHASERFVQMDVFRRFSTGRLADILIKPVADSFLDDFAAIRAAFSTQTGRPLEEHGVDQASPKTLALFQAYSAGVNKWLEELRDGDEGAIFPREFSHPFLDYDPEDVPPWTPEDCVASVVALVDLLTNTETEEINAGLARAEIGNDAKFSDLWSRRPLEESSILPPGWQPPGSTAALAQKRAGPSLLQPPAPLRPLSAAPALRRLTNKLKRIDWLRELLGGGVLGGDVGSNSWVVAGSRTANGNALLSNDPHLGMSQPAIWYLAHLDAKTNGTGDFHSAGVTFVGLPWVIIGQNENIAWGFTTTNMDYTDVYVEDVVRDDGGDPTGVVFQGDTVEFIRVPWTATFSDGTTHEFCDGSGCDSPALLFVERHGPVREILNEAPDDPAEDLALTLRWTGHDLDTDIDFLTELHAATNMEEARAALELMTTIGQNVVVVDTAGSIGWFPYSRLPKRTWATDLDGGAPSWLPIDGRGDYEWTEYFALDELPQLLDPEEGYIATANNDMTGALFDGNTTSLGPPYQVTAAAGFRHKRIVELIESDGDQHSVDTMNRIIGDVYMLIGERMRPGIMAIVDDPQTGDVSNDGQKVLNALEAWNFTCPTGLDGPYADSDLVTDADELREASGCMAFHALLNRIRIRIEQNENAPSTYDPDVRDPSFATYYSIVDDSQLNAGDIYWDNPETMTDETKYDVMPEILEETGSFLVNWLGPDEQQWAWGRLHGLLLESDIGGFLGPDFDNPCSGALCARPDRALFANDGGLYTIDVAYPRPVVDANEFIQTWGASTRFVCEVPPTGPKCTYQLPGGQSGHVESPFYEDLLFLYLDNQPIDVVFDINEAAANAVRTVTFE